MEIPNQEENSKKLSTNELLEKLKKSAREDVGLELLDTQETEANTSQPYTMEDYIDSLEQLQIARRFLAKEYERYNLDSELINSNQDYSLARANTSRSRPDWEDYLPKDDSEAEQSKWREFLDTFNTAQYIDSEGNNFMKESLEHYRRVYDRHQEIIQTPGLSGKNSEIAIYSQEKFDTMRRVAAYRILEKEEDLLLHRIEAYYAEAVLNNETRWHSKETISDLEGEIEVRARARRDLLQSENDISELARRRNLDAKREFDDGVLMTQQMSDVARKHMDALLRGQHLLIKGETGGAKSALAKKMARDILAILGKGDIKPILVSGDEAQNTHVLMGSKTLEGSKDEIHTPFKMGPVTKAISEGIPLILDEVNAIPSGIIKRLNEIMLLKPYDTYPVQENGGEAIIVKPGFCIISTMNEKSHRYRGIEELSQDHRDRYGSNIAEIHYPDLDVQPGGESVPTELLKLVMVCCTDKNSGKVEIKNMSFNELIAFVRVAHMTQVMFNTPVNDASLVNYVPTERALEASSGETALSKSAISPRTMLQIIDKVQTSNGKISLSEAIYDKLIEFRDKMDRDIIRNLLENFGFKKSHFEPTVAED